jgi:hypothetical protein
MTPEKKKENPFFALLAFIGAIGALVMLLSALFLEVV